MTTYKVNDEAVRKAEQMIDARQYTLDSAWGDANPDTDDGNAEVERNGWEGYGEWHLAIDTDAGEETKDRYGFPYGDFARVHRSGLIHAKQRAAQNGHDEVERAAERLLKRLDSVSAS